MRRVVVHGHFYQPPREDPWLELVPQEPTAAPSHDWNARIAAECYLPLGRAPVLDGRGWVQRVVDCYGWCSFDAGPTLLRWCDDHAPHVRDAMRAGDREALERWGFGNAVAMPYHHLILPLATARDKVTEVRWGIADFRARFGREPEGMWLPETAVDTATLQVLADEGIRFTILAPHQITPLPPHGRPGLWRAPNGRTLAIFTYDGALAHELAFGDLLRDAERWHATVDAFPDPADGKPRIVAMATDGETFGHHHHFGDLGLAAFIAKTGAEMSNFAALLDAWPPTDAVQLVEDTSWSCVHGIERWRSDCGCNTRPGTSQAWRAPLREGLDSLAASLHALALRDWPGDAGDLDHARDAAGGDLAGAAALPELARRWLEAEREALTMFSSCAWFFDDIAGLEPQLALRHAARALDLVPRDAVAALVARLVATLATARSNDPAAGDGATVWTRDVLPFIHQPARLAAGLAALRDLAPDALDDLALPSYRWTLDGDALVTVHRRTGETRRWLATPTTFGVVAVTVVVTAVDADNAPIGEPLEVSVHDYPEPVRDLLRSVVRPMVFDATLSPADRQALANGVLDGAMARGRAADGALALIDRDGPDAADVVMHGVLDLFELDQLPFPDPLRARLFRRLAPLPPGPARAGLARRLALALPTAAAR